MRFPFDPKARLLVVHATLFGPAGYADLRLAVDTGATFTIIGRKPIGAAGYLASAEYSHQRVITVSGPERAPRVRVVSLRLLGKECRDFPVLCYNFPHDLGVDGLLGLDFLRRFRLIVDFPKGTISLR